MRLKKLLFTIGLFSLLVILTGCNSVTVPEIRNVDEVTAKEILSSNDLIPAIKVEHNEEVTAGCVIKTEPSIGTSVEKESIVTVYISKGPALTVPNVKNLDEETAKSILAANTLIPEIKRLYDSEIDRGNVVKTNPEIGSSIEPNTQITVYISNGPVLVVPELNNIEVETAKSILTASALIPEIERIYDSDIVKGNVVKTNPESGSLIKPNERIILYVSNGPKRSEASHATISWRNLSSKADDKWYLEHPFILEDTLYICCYKVIFNVAGKWIDEYNTGLIIGNATIDGMKTIPVTAAYDNREWNAQTEQSIVLEIPLRDVGIEKPTKIETVLFAKVGEEHRDVEVDFTISW